MTLKEEVLAYPGLKEVALGGAVERVGGTGGLWPSNSYGPSILQVTAAALAWLLPLCSVRFLAAVQPALGQPAQLQLCLCVWGPFLWDRGLPGTGNG